MITVSLSQGGRAIYTFNKIFIIALVSTMAKKYSVMYHNHKGNTVFSVRQMFERKSDALVKFGKGVEYLRTDYDGFSYIALMRKNSNDEWVVSQYADNVGGCYGES